MFSISCNSSRRKRYYPNAFRLSINWATELAPINTLVTRSSFNNQASAISAKVCPRRAATSFSLRAFSTASGVSSRGLQMTGRFRRTGILRNSTQILIRKQALRQRRERYHTHPLPSIQAINPVPSNDRTSNSGLGESSKAPYVLSVRPRPYGSGLRHSWRYLHTKPFLAGRYQPRPPSSPRSGLRVRTMGVKDIHVFQSHPFQALIQASH